MIGREDTFFKVIKSSRKEFEHIKKHIGDYYYKKEEPKTDQFGKPRIDSDGEPEVRVLYPSKGRLKELQKIINSRVFSQINFPPVVHGSVKKKSCITNAKAHQGNKYFLLTDLRGYFPSIHFKTVYCELVEQGFSPTVASHITRLVTYNKCVPQGAPTSPMIANMVFLPQDLQLIEICQKHDITYTRYIDDLTFSSKKFIKNELIQKLLGVIRKSPFKYHHRKTKTSIGITEITGVITKNNNLDAPKRKYEKLAKLEPESNSAKGLIGHIEAIRKA